MENKKEINNLAKKYDLEMLVLFGSRADGTFREDSDFDIAFRSKKDFSFDDLVDLNNDLIKIFKCDKIDLVDLKKAEDPVLIHQISKNPKLLFGKEEDLIKFRVYAFSYYLDYEPFFKWQRLLIKKRQKALEKIISK